MFFGVAILKGGYYSVVYCNDILTKKTYLIATGLCLKGVI